MFHLSHDVPDSPPLTYRKATRTLCGDLNAYSDAIPVRWWNGRRDGVCPECLEAFDRQAVGATNPLCRSSPNDAPQSTLTNRPEAVQ